MKLRTRAALIVGLVLVFALGTTSVMMIRSSTADLREALQGKALVLGRELEQEISSVINLGVSLDDLPDLSQRCKAIAASHQELAFALVIDPKSVIRFHSDEKQVGQTARAALFNGSERPAGVLQYSADNDGKLVYNTLIPINDKQGAYRASVIMGLKSEVIAQKVARQVRYAVLLGSVSFAASLVLIIFFFTNKVSRPLAGLVKSSKAAAQGDLTQKIQSTTLDEIGELTQAFGEMLENLRSLQERVAASFLGLEEAIGLMTSHAGTLQAGTEKQSRAIAQIMTFIQHMNEQNNIVTVSMGNLSQTSYETSSSIMEMKSSIGEVAQSTESLSVSIEETSSSMEQVLVGNRSVGENIEGLAKLITETSRAIAEIGGSAKNIEGLAQESMGLSTAVKVNAEQQGSSAMKETITLMNEIREGVLTLSKTMSTLNSRVENIGAILNAIDELSEQTELLSLNAAIIAAEAGVHGRGFTVVAGEIRRLADSTSASTREITKVIAGIQEETRTVGAMVNMSVDRVDQGMAAARRADQTLRTIIEGSGNAAGMSNLIARHTTEQTSGSLKVAVAIKNVSEHADKIASAAADQSRGSGTITRAIENMRGLSGVVRRSMVEQASGAHMIAQASEGLTGMARGLTESIQKSKELGDRAVSDVTSILDITRETEAIVGRLNDIVENFVPLANKLKSTLSNFKT